MFAVINEQSGLVAITNERLKPCMDWLLAKANEYMVIDWLNPDECILRLKCACVYTWKLVDLRKPYKWVVSSGQEALGIFHTTTDAQKWIEATWGPALYTPQRKEAPDWIAFACSQASGIMARLPVVQ